MNQAKEKVVVAVLGAGINKKRRPGVYTWWRMFRAAGRRKSLSRSGVETCYVIAPNVASSGAAGRMLLLLALSGFDDDADKSVLMPDFGDSLSPKEQLPFAQRVAAERGAKLVVF
jgi:hypothetical protein